ncbi:MAG: 4-(cytidine 5'-diphospho)-2-C-methyl-D-erythritol kinase [Candidatus Midichloria sp.]|nr:4-(cytidine 5'-diphospho)-2-C-methyl-D-erythritol kinase [Candidatus Midichloria sp.]
MQILQKSTHAKINLFLHIVGQRGDSYHLLESLFAKLKVHDTVTVQQYNELICNTIGHAINGSNIAIKAAEKLKDFVNLDLSQKLAFPSNTILGASITINKRIPIGAGLGGGSADAATVLKLLVKLWNIKINKKDLNEIALSIGADVPFCLQDKAAFVTGIGEKISEPLELGRKLDLVLINPGYEILAKDVYCLVKKYSPPLDRENIYELIFKGRNDLEEIALEICKDLIEVKTALREQKNVRVVRMSGSGPTYFAIFDNANLAELAKNNLIKEHPNWLIWQDRVWI